MKNLNKFAEHGGQARVLALIAYRVLRPIYWLILTLGALLWMPVSMLAGHRLASAACYTGYDPASMNSSNLPQSQVIHYDKNFVKNLKANTCALRCCNRRELPPQSGNQHRLYMYNAMTAKTQQAAEGVVGTGSTVSVVSTTATIGNYADYVNVSHMAMQTTIDPALENIQKELAYRLGLTLTKIVLQTADGAGNIDSSVYGQSLAYNVAFGRSVITSAVASLQGRNVMAFDRGRMIGMIHPFIVGDALNDTTNNSVVDILKRTAEGQEKLQELPSPDGDEVPVLEIGGVSFLQTTLVTQTANYQSQGGTALRTYIFGDEAIIAISLGKVEGAKIGDGDWRNLKMWMNRWDAPTPSDPSRMIGGSTAYNTYFTATLPPDTTMRMRYIDAQSNIS